MATCEGRFLVHRSCMQLPSGGGLRVASARRNFPLQFLADVLQLSTQSWKKKSYLNWPLRRLCHCDEFASLAMTSELITRTHEQWEAALLSPHRDSPQLPSNWRKMGSRPPSDGECWRHLSPVSSTSLDFVHSLSHTQ